MKIENLCINCMQERRSPDGICEFCGFDVRTFELPRHHMRPFTILAGKYLIGNAIGEGGFGITYIGMDLNLEVKVAIKEYYPQGAAVRDCRTNDSTVWSYSKSTQVFFEEGREKFINEAKTIAKFRNVPEIVGVIDFFRENQTAYIVMEYLDGQTLKQYLKAKGGKIQADELLRMMKPLIASLGKLHAQGLIHRDISPDNIMLMKDGSIKILDFGGARDFVSQNGKSMSVLVKHGYAPEEQYRSRGDQGPWTDVYALCATMYRCITGKIPPEALDRLYEDELKSISSFNVACPKYIEQAITKGLSVRKDGRYQSMEELYDALYKEQKEPKKPTKSDKKKPPEPPKPKNNKTKLIIAAAATVAVGIAVIAGVGIKMKQPDEKVTAKAVATPTPSVKDEITVIPTPELIIEPTATLFPTEKVKKKKYRLSVMGGDGSGDYEAGKKVKISTQEETSSYFPVWRGDSPIWIENPYLDETEVIMTAHNNSVYMKGGNFEVIEAGTSGLVDDSGSFIIKIEGENYMLPISAQEFQKRGWDYSIFWEDLFGGEFDEDIVVDSEIFWEKVGNVVETECYQQELGTTYSEDEDKAAGIEVKVNVEDRQIDIVELEFWENDLQVELPGGIIRGKSTKEEFENVYGKPEYKWEGNYETYYKVGNVIVGVWFENDIVDSIFVRKIPSNNTLSQE